MNRYARFALFATAVLFAAMTAGPCSAEERATGGLDLVLLLDKSLSMAPFFDEVKAYAAGEVLGPILVPGDRLVVELVYGKVHRLFAGPIASEADKASAIRSLRGVVADGPYTDLGSALDVAKRDVDELGSPERPKYVLLLTDERQEAPEGSPYRSSDYKLRHPSLEYVKRVDLGHFRSIAIGLQVGAKVDAAAPNVVRYLSEPPASRSGAVLSGAAGQAVAGGKTGGSTTAATPMEGKPAKGGGARRAIAFLAGAVALLALAAIIILLVKKRDRAQHEEKQQRGET